MKFKISSLKQVIAIIFAFVILFFGIYLGRCVSTVNYFNCEQQKEILSELHPSKIDDRIYYEGSTEPSVVKSISEFLDAQTVNITNAFDKGHWKIYISRKCFSDYKVDDNYFLSGLTNQQNHTIYLYDWRSDEATFLSFVHEFGHFINYIAGLECYTGKFNDIYETYKDSYVDSDVGAVVGYATSNKDEFFASLVKDYYCSPQKLKDMSMDVYVYISDIVTTSNYQDDEILFQYKKFFRVVFNN